jgi:hypothetical protein
MAAATVLSVTCREQRNGGQHSHCPQYSSGMPIIQASTPHLNCGCITAQLGKPKARSSFHTVACEVAAADGTRKACEGGPRRELAFPASATSCIACRSTCCAAIHC